MIIRWDVMILDEMMRHGDLALSRITKDKMWLSERRGDKQNWDVMRWDLKKWKKDDQGWHEARLHHMIRDVMIDFRCSGWSGMTRDHVMMSLGEWRQSEKRSDEMWWVELQILLSRVMFLVCESLWVKASATWINVNEMKRASMCSKLLSSQRSEAVLWF